MSTTSARKGNSSPVDDVIAAHEAAVAELTTVKAWRSIGHACQTVADLADVVKLDKATREVVDALASTAADHVRNAPNHIATREALDAILKVADIGALTLSEGQRARVDNLKDRESAAAIVSKGKGTRAPGGESIPATFPHPLTVPATDGHKGYRGANRNAFQRALKDNASARGIDPTVAWNAFKALPDMWADNAATVTVDVAGIPVTRG